MLRIVKEKHPVAEFFAKALVGFAVSDIVIICALGIAGALHLL